MSTSLSYELLVILAPDRNKNDQDKTLKEIKTQIELLKGASQSEEIWGLRALAYKIKGYEEGFYALITFTLLASKLKELEHYLRLERPILRHLLTKASKVFDQFNYNQMIEADAKFFATRTTAKNPPQTEESSTLKRSAPFKTSSPVQPGIPADPELKLTATIALPIADELASSVTTKKQEPLTETKPLLADSLIPETVLSGSKKIRPEEDHVDEDFERKLQDIIAGDI
jgi:small subunit ribosomal protein S6